jgi:hypothetical protein
MEVSVPVLGIVLLIFTLHTVLTHLLNWAYRKAWQEDGVLVFLTVLLTIVEVIICVSLLDYYIK